MKIPGKAVARRLDIPIDINSSPFTNGFHSVVDDGPKHPLEETEAFYDECQENLEFQTLKSTQGIHAPLRLKMEREAARKVGRLPCLPSSNLMLEVLENKEESLAFDDIFYDQFDECQSMVPPHMIIEKMLGI